jgi:hypothetical protein
VKKSQTEVGAMQIGPYGVTIDFPLYPLVTTIRNARIIKGYQRLSKIIKELNKGNIT